MKMLRRELDQNQEHAGRYPVHEIKFNDPVYGDVILGVAKIRAALCPECYSQEAAPEIYTDADRLDWSFWAGCMNCQHLWEA